MYYEIIKFVKKWPEAQVKQLLAKWDRCVAIIPQHFSIANDLEGRFFHRRAWMMSLGTRIPTVTL